jgi:hypothetical protein
MRGFQDSNDEDEDVTVDAGHYSIYSLNTLQFAMRNSCTVAIILLE